MPHESTKKLLDRLLAKGEKALQQIINEECWTTEEFEAITGHDEKTLFLMAEEGVFFYAEHDGIPYWPKFQIVGDQKTTPDGFNVVMALLRERGHKQWGIYTFWTTSSVRWNDPTTPFDLLRQDRLQDALWDARTYWEHGAK
jgi:hypothetical protein